MKKRYKMLAVGALAVFLFSTLFFLKVNTAAVFSAALMDEAALGKLCIEQVVPTAREINADDVQEESTQTAENGEGAGTGGKQEEGSEDGSDADENAQELGDPEVIIYHTHSTESYMPYNESNYHRESEEGTVRDVGNVLEEELKKKGINVVHDKTVHDRPSYNASYGRSLSTVKALMEKYPTAEYVIDLHRDAAASGKGGKLVEIDGQNVAAFSLVVGKGNDNYRELYAFAKRVSEAAESRYEGFGGSIIEKEYRYNGFVSNKALLLEVGNNKNTIEESRACAKYFAEVMAKVIRG